jgi:hypothetical protein
VTAPAAPPEIANCVACDALVARWRSEGKAFGWEAVRVTHHVFHRLDPITPPAQGVRHVLATSITLGIQCALDDLGVALVGCEPALLSGWVIRQMRQDGHLRTNPAAASGPEPAQEAPNAAGVDAGTGEATDGTP